MANSSSCGKCCLPILGLQGKIECYGSCGEVFHLPCVQLNEYDHRRCEESANVLWLCDFCLALFRKKFAVVVSEPVREPDNNESSIETTIHQMQSDIAEMKRCFSELRETTIKDHSSISYCQGVPSTSTPKNNSSHNASKLSTGTKIMDQPTRSSKRFWMFFTRIAKHVTENEVVKMVTDCLHLANPPDIVKITPRWMNEHNVRYNSFKVGFQSINKEIALRESTWPSGLMFREFEDHSHEIALWEP